MPWVGFDPTISTGERPKTYALDRAATGTGNNDIVSMNINFSLLEPHSDRPLRLFCFYNCHNLTTLPNTDICLRVEIETFTMVTAVIDRVLLNKY